MPQTPAFSDEFQRTFTFGKIAYGNPNRKANAVSVEVSLRRRAGSKRAVDGTHVQDVMTFSAVGAIWNASHSDWTSGGQNLDEIAKYTGQLSDPALFRRILALWRRWHLNDMRAGTPAQMAAIEDAKVKAIEAMRAEGYEVTDDGYGRPIVNGAPAYGKGRYYYGHDHYTWACDVLKAAGLYTVEFGPELPDANGGMAREVYTYGHSWLVEPLPEDVMAEIEAIMRLEGGDYAKRFDAWLALDHYGARGMLPCGHFPEQGCDCASLGVTA